VRSPSDVEGSAEEPARELQLNTIRTIASRHNSLILDMETPNLLHVFSFVIQAVILDSLNLRIFEFERIKTSYVFIAQFTDSEKIPKKE
jgi:hypothetical protein